MSNSLNSIKGALLGMKSGPPRGLLRGDARSLDCSSHGGPTIPLEGGSSSWRFSGGGLGVFWVLH